MMGHVSRFKQGLQREMGKESTFEEDFTKLAEIVLNPDENYKAYQLFLNKMLLSSGEFVSEFYTGSARFHEMWMDKAKSGTLSSLIKVIPEDKLIIQINEGHGSINISDGSPGQKCAALLAFILNSGNDPLIIDQPEDDLDNSLIYSLIVQSIRKMKNKRQIIIVTHNPNIPVLGDAEAIFILERDINGKVSFRNGKKAGCIEEKTIKEGICDVMEGGEEAFRKREQKYQYN